MNLAHQVGADPLHLHELLIILAATGGSVTALAVYIRYYVKSLFTKHRSDDHAD